MEEELQRAINDREEEFNKAIDDETAAKTVLDSVKQRWAAANREAEAAKDEIKRTLHIARGRWAHAREVTRAALAATSEAELELEMLQMQRLAKRMRNTAHNPEDRLQTVSWRRTSEQNAMVSTVSSTRSSLAKAGDMQPVGINHVLFY
jgi:chromosome segregation ATPase